MMVDTIRQAHTRRSHWRCSGVLAILLLFGLPALATAEEERPSPGLTNGGFETAADDGKPEGWYFVRRPDQSQKVSLVTADVVEGHACAFVDASTNANEFTNVMQVFDATSLRGQRVRFRAAVKTADLSAQSRVQLWFRVDREDGVGAFNNMQDRPIRAETWEHFEIVLDVAEDAQRINVGMFLIGSAKAWIDDATVEAVDKEIALTPNLGADAPTQPFFTPWLLLALCGVILCVVGMTGTSALAEPEGEVVSPGRATLMQRFALRFALAYWLLYLLPAPFSVILPSFLLRAYGAINDTLVRWSAVNVFGIDKPLVAPNGSGDTTHAYVSLFVYFVLALLLAGATLFLDRRGAKHGQVLDLLRSYLRYALAMTMLSYGLAKLGQVSNQFPILEGARLDRTYGESSPMGLLWSFMGASRPYTFFAGFGEALGGTLLLFRRTTLLGALTVFGVMLNVVMLNFCYDVPVKQYSLHLALAGILIAVPDWRRLAGLFLLNREIPRPLPVRAFAGPRGRWPRRVAKVVLVLFVGVLPISGHLWRNLRHTPAATQNTEADESLLMNRGFRWISEIPFNR